MGGIASAAQLRMSFLRWAVVVVPLVLLLGFASGRSVATGDDSAWYVALAKPALTPPGWLFPLAWTLLYVLIGFALAMVLHARGARGRWLGVGLFALQLALNLTWTPVFFGMHQVGTALVVILAMLAAAVATTVVFGGIRRTAAWLMVPYLVWIAFAGVLTWRIGQLNPDAATLVPASRTTQML